MNDTTPLSRAEQAAIMVTLLDDDQAAAILAELSPAELKQLGERMCALGEIGPQAIQSAIGDFVERTTRPGLPASPREDRVRNLMARALGDIKADGMMQRIAPEAGTHQLSSLEILRWLAPDTLIRLVRDEHPQAIALFLIQLEPDMAALVLRGLPDGIQSDVVHRVATLGPVPAEALAMLEELVTHKLKDTPVGPETLDLGGPQDAASILTNSDRAVEKRIMPELQKRDRALAKTIEEQLFKFEHLFVLDPLAMGMLLREVESEVLIDALKGIGEDQREIFFSAMSSRAADGLRDEIAERRRLKLTEVISAQKQIVAIAKQLAGEGAISFGREEDDYV